MFRDRSEPRSLTQLPSQAGDLHALSPDGCHLPAVAVAQASLIRKEVIVALWPEVVDDESAVRALIISCNSHSQALWWIQHRNEATDAIKHQIHRLLSLRSLAQTERQTFPL